MAQKIKQVEESLMIKRLTRVLNAGVISAAVAAFMLGSSIAKAEKIVIATGADPNFGVFYVAHAAGLFEKRGLDVDLKTGASGSAQVPLLISGDAQFAFGSGGACMVNHNLKPEKVALIAEGSILNEYDGVVARSGFESLESLKGKKVGLALGTGSEVFFTTVVERNGMKIEDFNVVPVEAPEMIAALERNDIDAYAAWEPWVTRGVQSIKGSKMIMSSKGIWSPSSYICGDRTWILNNMDAATKVVEAFVEAAELINNDREQGAQLISKVLKLDIDLTQALVNKCVYRTHLAKNLGSIEDDYKNMVLRAKMPENPTRGWWAGFIFDAPLRAAAPGNVGYDLPGS
jgi:ABC-type nitrate/sulfonate/bicarbonate transport system substrate-binding protein